MSKEVEILKKALERAKSARKEAERFLEQRSLELYLANQELTTLNKNLEEKVQERAEEIEKQKDFYEALLNNLPADVVVADKNHRYLFINPKAVSNPEVRAWMIGKDDFEYCRYRNKPISIAEERRDMFNRVQETGEIVEWTEELINSDGETEHHLRRWFPVVRNGQTIMFIGYALDISETIKSRELIVEARVIAEKATLAKSEFLSKMSHEIRTPLNAIIGLTEILLQEKIEDDLVTYVQSMKYSADNLLGIINEVLDFSKIEAGKLTFERTPFDLRWILNGVRQTFEFRLNELGIDFISEIDEDIPTTLIGDRIKLNQIFLNIVGNAIKFTEKGFIRITAFLTKSEDNQCWVEFKIQDTGIGIAASRIEHVFKGFEQEALDTTRKYGGTGLGLTITKRIIEGQNGTIKVESEKGVGTTFIFTLPFGISFEQYNFDEKGDTQGPNDLSRNKILIAEDNLMNQLVLKKVLEKWSPQLTIVENGIEALKKMKTETYNLVLLDIQMPEKGGIETIKDWRKYEKENELNPTPVVALTADAFSESRTVAMEAGMDDFLSKPIDLSELSRILSTYITS